MTMTVKEKAMTVSVINFYLKFNSVALLKQDNEKLSRRQMPEI